MTLRTYQREAVEATYEYLRTCDGNPCIVIPGDGEISRRDAETQRF